VRSLTTGVVPLANGMGLLRLTGNAPALPFQHKRVNVAAKVGFSSLKHHPSYKTRRCGGTANAGRLSLAIAPRNHSYGTRCSVLHDRLQEDGDGSRNTLLDCSQAD
jgi:hypothetical protein